MLEQVGKAVPALGLVLGPDIVPDRDPGDRRLVVLVDHDRQPILEVKNSVRDRHLLDERRDRHRLRWRGRRGRRDESNGGEQSDPAELVHRLESPR